jgi:hypothetical protein
VRKINILYWATRAAKAGQQSLVPSWKAQQTNHGRTSFLCTLWVPIYLCFKSQQRPPPLCIMCTGYGNCVPNCQQSYKMVVVSLKGSHRIGDRLNSPKISAPRLASSWWVVEWHNFSPYPSRGTVPLTDILSLKNGYGCFDNFCILHMLNWPSASCFFDFTKPMHNSSLILGQPNIKSFSSFCHSISICIVYSMHLLAWSKHYLCPPSWLRFECSSVAWESTTTLQLFGLEIFWFGYIISSGLPAWSFSLDMCTQVSFRVHLFGAVQVTYILKR